MLHGIKKLNNNTLHYVVLIKSNHLKLYQIINTLMIILLLISCKNEYAKKNNNSKENISIKEVSNDTTSVTQRNTLINDTFYLFKRDFTNWDTKYYEHVYITKDPKQYLRLVPYVKYENFSLINHSYNNSEWKNHRYKIEIGEIPKKWTEVIYYGKEFYLKSPSDFCLLNQIIITDSCLISRSCEGPSLQKITKVTKLNSIQYEINLGFDKNKPSKTKITLIDKELGIAVWQTEQNDNKLYADIDKYKRIPIAKSDCNGNKCANEIKSENIDILSLIKNAMQQ